MSPHLKLHSGCSHMSFDNSSKLQLLLDSPYIAGVHRQNQMAPALNHIQYLAWEKGLILVPHYSMHGHYCELVTATKNGLVTTSMKFWFSSCNQPDKNRALIPDKGNIEIKASPSIALHPESSINCSLPFETSQITRSTLSSSESSQT